MKPTPMCIYEQAAQRITELTPETERVDVVAVVMVMATTEAVVVQCDTSGRGDAYLPCASWQKVLRDILE